jgi:hypothetical protein
MYILFSFFLFEVSICQKLESENNVWMCLDFTYHHKLKMMKNYMHTLFVLYIFSPFLKKTTPSPVIFAASFSCFKVFISKTDKKDIFATMYLLWGDSLLFNRNRGFSPTHIYQATTLKVFHAMKNPKRFSGKPLKVFHSVKNPSGFLKIPCVVWKNFRFFSKNFYF